MAETGDLINEFKQAKPPEKIVIVVGVFAVAGVAWYLYKKGQAQAAVSSSNTGAPTSQTAGYPTVGPNGTPVLPYGVTPQYDPNGNLISFQNPPPPGTTPPPDGPPTTGPVTPQNWYANLIGKLGYNTKINPGGYDVNGQRFWTGKNQFFYAPIGTTIAYGSQGRVWLNPGGDTSQHVLLTGPGLMQSNTTVAKTAAGSTH